MDLCYRNNQKSLFRKYAGLVTWFANTQLGRDYLKHNNFYIPSQGKLAFLLPNGYIETDGHDAKITVTTKPCYTRIFSALHVIDTLQGYITSFREAQEILLGNLGLRYISPRFLFDTGGPYYPDVHPETTTTDGVVYTETKANWGLARDPESGTAAATTNTADYCAAENITGGYGVYRLFFLFDASAIPNDATVSAATFSIYGSAVDDDYGDESLHVVASAPASNTDLAVSDFHHVTFTTMGSKTLATYSTVAYNDVVLNATGIAAVSITDITKYAVIMGRDLSNTDPSTLNNRNYIQSVMADTGSNKPKLVVTYSVPSGYPVFFGTIGPGFVEF
jgi:hypothetical protein